MNTEDNQTQKAHIYEEHLKSFLTKRVVQELLATLIPWACVWFIAGIACGGWVNKLGETAGYLAIFTISIARAIGRASHAARNANGDLVDWQIHHSCKNGVISPYNPELVEPNSYDMTLGTKYTRILPNGELQEYDQEEMSIEPGECLLAHTVETIKLPPELKGLIQGKSSWARLNIFVECAGLFDSGFEGTAVLELFNSGKHAVLLKKGDRIAQMSFHRSTPAALPYGHPSRDSHYQKQQGAQSSWLSKLNRIQPR